VTDSTDWRVTISLSGQANVEQARQSFSEQEVEEDVRRRLGHNIVIGAGDSQIFLYAGTEVAAREAERTTRDVLGQLGIEAEYALHRWHPIEEEWQSPDVAMPQTEAERQAEHQRLEDAEAADSAAAGTALWQARAELPSHREAVALAHKLQGEGYTVVRRWKFLIVGANSDDDARALAEHIRQEAPADAEVTAEPVGVRLPFIPF
jgi:FMN phosphatase YigB (HAD superfamily)